MVFFTSDTHFCHEGILQYRPQFTSLDAMHDCIVSNWNQKVKKGDVVYHLGDFALTNDKNDPRPAQLLKQLNGQVFLICGNHDRKVVKCAGFVWVGDYKRIKANGQAIVLSHYPFRSWHGMHKGAWHLHGHSHLNLFDIGGLIMDICIERDYFLLSFDEVAEYMKGRQFVAVDHHKI